MVQTLRRRNNAANGTNGTASTSDRRKRPATRDGTRVRLTDKMKAAVTVRDSGVKKVIVTRKKLQQQVKRSSTRNKASSSSATFNIKPIESIRDFKKIEGQTYYLVHRTGSEPSQDTWEAEETIESLDILGAFRERVQTASGYAIDNNTTVMTDETATTNANVRRSTRTSKTRAMLRMTEPIAMDSSSDDEVATASRSSKKGTTTRKKRSNSESGGKSTAPKKLRGQAARKAAEVEERHRRMEERATKTDAAIVNIDETDCCLRCSIFLYRQAVENDDLEMLKAAVNDKEHVPFWEKEDCQHWSDMVVAAAMLKGNKEVVGLLLQSQEVGRVQVPTKYMEYSGSTGYVSRFTFGHAVSKVNESRGNRQGNSAFYRNSQKNLMEVDISRLSESLIAINVLSALQDTTLDPDMADFVKSATNLVRGCSMFMEQKGFYYCVASGNWNVAGNIINHIQYRSGFNTVHTNVLNFKNGEPLETYRRNQILKKSFDAGSITPLECAAIHPSRAYLKELFEQLTPAERIETDEFGRTIAHFAAASTTPDCLEYLIEQDFPFSSGDKFKLTPLIQAARFGRHQNIRPLLKHLSKGDMPNTEFADQTLLRQRWRPLHYAAYFGHPETCRELIDCGATVEAIESTLRATPLLFAAQRGHLECVKVLVELGKADPEAVDKYGRTALHLASINGKYDVAKYLLQIGVDADAADTSQNRPIHYAAGFGHLRLLRLLIEVGGANPAAPNVWRTTACSVANLKGHISIVQYLLTECNIDVNFKDQDGKTLLHHCVEETVTSKLEAEQLLRKARLLISKNADPNLQTIEGNTVLHSFTVGYFNAHRPAGWIDEDMEGNEHVKPLEYDDRDGIEYSRQMAKLLLDAGANLDIKNNAGDTPLAMGIIHNKDYVFETYIEHGAKYWDTMTSSGITFFQCLLASAGELDSFSARREIDRVRNAGYEAMIKGIWGAIVRNPAPAGADTNINIPNSAGFTAMLSAVRDVCDNQKKHVKEEKERIKKIYTSASKSYAQGGNSDDRSVREDAVFELRFHHWLDMATKVVENYHPDMNAVVQLPKDFYKVNPKRSKSEYPRETGWSVLHFATTTQDVNLLHFLLSHGSDPNQRTIVDGVPTGDPPMLSGYIKKRFIHQDYLPDTDLQTIEHANKLFNIIKPEFKQLLPNAIKKYIAFGANPCVANKEGFSTLMMAAKSLDHGIMEDLCTAYTKTASFEGIDNRDQDHHHTALMYAVDAVQEALSRNDQSVNVLVVKHLLVAGANPNLPYQNARGDTVIMKIIRSQHLPLLSTVIEHTRYPIDHSAVNNYMETCAIITCKNKNEAISKTYFDLMASSYASSPFDVNVNDNDNNTALSLASTSGNEHAVNVLLECNADPNHTVGANITPLCRSVQNAYLHIAQSLLKAGANVNHQDDQGLSPLHHAVLVEKYHLVKLMLEFGANVHAVDKKQRTALHIAIQKTKNMTNASLRIERLLLQGGSDINAKDILGRTPLHLAFIHMDVVPHMRKMAMIAKKVKKIREDKKNAEIMESKVTSAVEKYSRDAMDSGANEWIAYAVRAQLEDKQQKEATSKEKNDDDDEDTVIIEEDETADLELYAQFQWEMDTQSPSKVDPIDIIKFLSNYQDIQYDLADHFGRTPLHYAAAVGAFSSTSILIAKGVNINAEDLDQNTPLQLSLRYKHVDYSVMLCDQGATPSSVMTLPIGDPVTTLNYSLSQDFMNMAYLILDRHPRVLESLQDALRTGKFHVADILLNSVPTSSLSATTQEGQNLWHIIANFKPFDSEIWDEYLPDVIAKVAELGLPFEADMHGRTPIHYAAMHGQKTLLNNLLSAGGSNVNQKDKDGLSELWYAASSHDIQSVQLLLNAGALIGNGTSSATKESALLLAVKSKDIYLVKLLLESNAPHDEDSIHGRTNAVMQACVDKSDKILKELLKAGVDPNVPSTATYYLKGKKKTVVIQPVFIATDTTFKVLINGGADPNVVSPKQEPWEGRSCFMYLSNSTENRELLKLLLKQNDINLNLQDSHSNRPIFYHYFFDSKSDDWKSILSQMMQDKKPNVNMVDPTTGMTPLEYAIRKHNSIHVERLLELGADPNMESCRSSGAKRDDLDLYEFGPLNAVFHAIAQNDLSILQAMCRKTKFSINWTAKDRDGRTAVSFLVGNGYSHENVAILKFIATTTGSNFLNIADTPDNNGLRAIDYASARERKELYEALIELGVAPGDVEMDAADEVQEPTMNVDEYIAMQAIEEDAEAERAILEAEAKEAAIKANGGKEVSEDDDREKAVVDPISDMHKIGKIVFDDNNDPYDIMVQKVDVGNGYYGCNMFYKLSIIYNTVLDLYVLWTRWGSFGETGMRQRTPYLSKEECVAEFRSIFRSKTGNHWDDHKPEKFIPKPGRFELILAKPPKKPVILKDFMFLKTTVPSQLPRTIFNAMNIFCDFEALNQEFQQLELDIPAGHIPEKHMEEAYDTLKKISKEVEKYASRVIYATKEERAQKKEMGHRLVQLSNKYYRLFPKSSHKNGIVPIVLKHNLQQELARLNNINYLNFSINVLLAAKRRSSEIHPLDYCFRSLHCQLTEIDTGTSEFNMVQKYMLTTAEQSGYEITHLFSVNREGEEERFEKFAKNSNRKLLWHGSHVNNFMGILKQGLRTKPASAEASGSMFGNGIYFADMFAKSINYSSNGWYEQKHPGYALLLLCEVALGEECEMAYYTEHNYQKDKHMSVKGLGRQGPNPANAIYDKNGAQVLMGPPIAYDFPDTLYYYQRPRINHNEYVVYDENQIKIKYMVLVRNNNYCELCQTNRSYDSSSMDLSKYEFKDGLQYTQLGEYERGLVRLHLTHAGKTTKEMFDDILDAYLKAEGYKPRWKPSMPITRSSKVCKNCAHTMTAMMFVDHIEKQLPDTFRQRQRCQYGEHCNKKNDLTHAKAYKHWFLSNLKDEENKVEEAQEIEDEDEAMSDSDSYASDEDSD